MSLSKKAAKAKKLPVKKSILEWCKELDDAGNELSVVWEGGGDSGWVHFEIDGDDVDNEYTRALVDLIDETLDYGSWAGEFSSSGKAIYDSKTNSFEGTDYYSEESHDVLEDDIVIEVPKKLWFETLHIECEASYDESPNMSVRFIVKNGFLTREHSDFCSNLEATLKDHLSEIFDSYKSPNDTEFRGCNDSWILERKDGIEKDDVLIFNIKKIDIETMTTEDKTVVLELNEETVKSIDYRLNDEYEDN